MVPFLPKGLGDDGDFQVTFDGVPGREPLLNMVDKPEPDKGELGRRQGRGEYMAVVSPFGPLIPVAIFVG